MRNQGSSEKGKPVLYQYCRKILGKLIGVAMTDDVQVISVETWKQWRYIDLWANIRITCNGKEDFHAVLIENKAYPPTHHNQLDTRPFSTKYVKNICLMLKGIIY